MMNEGEVFEELYKDSDLTPDGFRSLFGDLIHGTSQEISLEAAELIFGDVPEVIKDAIDVLHKDIDNPDDAHEAMVQIQGLAQTIQSLYVLAGEQHREVYAKKYPASIARGDKEKLMAQLDADTAKERTIKDYLRNTYYNLTRASSHLQSILKSLTSEKYLEN